MNMCEGRKHTANTNTKMRTVMATFFLARIWEKKGKINERKNSVGGEIRDEKFQIDVIDQEIHFSISDLYSKFPKVNPLR
jgi:hypothetical protein